jgi:hypothetical protein
MEIEEAHTQKERQLRQEKIYEEAKRREELIM